MADILARDVNHLPMPGTNRTVKKGGRRPSGALPPNISPQEFALIVLMQNPGRWLIIGETVRGSSALAAALYRRGAEVQQLDGVTRARWTHEVPSVHTLWKVTGKRQKPRP